MLIIPAIDLRGGQCVRLRQGQFECATVYETNPVVLAKHYADLGATYLHVVDLDGAQQGAVQQLDLIGAMKSDTMMIQSGGGIRSLETARTCLAAGVNRLVIGSMAMTDPELTHVLISKINARNVVLALDVNIENGIPKPAIYGWQTTTERSLWDVVAFYQDAGIQHVLCTDIAEDGMMNGPNFQLYEEAVSRFPSVFWQASGGVRDVKDIRKLAKIGVSTVILGRTLYEGNFDLSSCLQEFTLC